MSELESGGFQSVIDDARIEDPSKVKRIVVCSGKVFYDLDAARVGSPHVSKGSSLESSASEQSHKTLTDSNNVAVIRLEQFYPFPASRLGEIFATYANATEIVWTQEEPQNMGGWTFVEPRLRSILPANATLRYIGRDASASPATGSYAIHNLEQNKLVTDSLTISTGGTKAAG